MLSSDVHREKRRKGPSLPIHGNRRCNQSSRPQGLRESILRQTRSTSLTTSSKSSHSAFARCVPIMVTNSRPSSIGMSKTSGSGTPTSKRGTPQLNGKVERSHRSDQQEFYQLLSYKGDVDLEAKLDEWERFYNFARPHGAHNGQTPYEALRDKLQ